MNINLNLFGQTLGNQEKIFSKDKMRKKLALETKTMPKKQAMDRNDENSRLEFHVDEREKHKQNKKGSLSDN